MDVQTAAWRARAGDAATKAVGNEVVHKMHPESHAMLEVGGEKGVEEMAHMLRGDARASLAPGGSAR